MREKERYNRREKTTCILEVINERQVVLLDILLRYFLGVCKCVQRKLRDAFLVYATHHTVLILHLVVRMLQGRAVKHGLKMIYYRNI